MKERRTYIVFTVWLAVVAAMAASLLTLLLMNRGGGIHIVNDEQFAMLARYARLDAVRDALETEYYEEVDSNALLTGAVKGMMASLDDPYTFYSTPEEMAQSGERDSGAYHGIGVVIRLDGDAVFVERVYSDSAADRAGVKEGDELVAVDGSRVSDFSDKMTETADLIRGEDGTTVTLTLRRDGVEREVAVERGAVNVSFVHYEMLDGGLGYLNLAQFTGGCIDDMNEALDFFRKEGAKGIVFDLRGNPGGQLDNAVAVADMFLPEGMVCYTEDRNGERGVQYADAEYWDIPMTVLVNGSSASASELFTAAFQDANRGTVVGTQTFGKGIMQTVVTFASDGAGMQYTTARYFSPNGRCIHETGIQPDVIVAPNEGDSISPQNPNPQTDAQLTAAMEALQKSVG